MNEELQALRDRVDRQEKLIKKLGEFILETLRSLWLCSDDSRKPKVKEQAEALKGWLAREFGETPPPEQSEPPPPKDLSDVLAEIQALKRQLGWSPDQVKTALQNRYGRDNQRLLTDEQLVQWRDELRDAVGAAEKEVA